MNIVKKQTGVDLRDAHTEVVYRNSQSVYNIQTFKSYICERIGERQRLCIRISRHGDVLAPHAINIPSIEIDYIEIQIGPELLRFESIEEASYFFHLVLADAFFVTAYVYLKPGYIRENCEMAWRCYFVMDSKNRMPFYDVTKSWQIPVARDLIYDTKGKISKRQMAKL